jgi:hypothetical protein
MWRSRTSRKNSNTCSLEVSRCCLKRLPQDRAFDKENLSPDYSTCCVRPTSYFDNVKLKGSLSHQLHALSLSVRICAAALTLFPLPYFSLITCYNFRFFVFKCWHRIVEPKRCTICFPFITINSLYIFQALICSSSEGTVRSIYNNWYILCVLCLLAAIRVLNLQRCKQPADIIRTKYTNCFIYSAFWWRANKCLKHVQAINRNKLKENNAYFGSIILIYYDARLTKY